MPRAATVAIRFPGRFSGRSFAESSLPTLRQGLLDRRLAVPGILALTLLLACPGLAPAQQPGGALPSTVIPAAQVYACGTGTSFTSVGVTTHANVLHFESPAGREHLAVGALRTGYKVCYAVSGVGALTAWDTGQDEGGWAAAVTTVQPNGPGTFPLEITRTTLDGRLRITRRFTGNSFVTPGGVISGDLNGNGVICDTMAECGNCTNRTLHVLTRIENLTGVTLSSVALAEIVDVDIAGDGSADRGAKTADSVSLYVDSADGLEAFGLMLQTLILPAQPEVHAFDGYDQTASGCAQNGLVTPTTPGDHELTLNQVFGFLGPGSSTGNAIRLHYRRF